MDIFKDTQERDENKVVVGVTGSGKNTDIDSFMDLINAGHPGGRVSIVGANVADAMARLAAK